MQHRKLRALLTILALTLAAPAALAFDFVESVDGDLSEDIAAPTDLGTTSIGSNTVNGFVVDVFGLEPDVDVFTFTVAPGQEVIDIVLTGYESEDDAGFAAIASGAVFPVDVNDPNLDLNAFLGGALFGNGGPSTALVGGSLLTEFGNAAAGGSGFSLPLPAGTYTIFVQQIGGLGIDYTFDIQTMPSAAVSRPEFEELVAQVGALVERIEALEASDAVQQQQIDAFLAAVRRILKRLFGFSNIEYTGGDS